MTPWEKTVQVEVENDGDIAQLPCPGRCIIDRIAIVAIADSNNVTADFYNRAFVSDTMKTVQILQDGASGNCLIFTPLQFPVSVGDVVAVSGATNGDYNTAHRVTQVNSDDRSFVTDQECTVPDYTASVTLAIPDAEHILNKVCTQLTGTSSGEVTPAVTYVNQDPQTNLTNRGYPRFLYAKFAAAGTYRVSLRVRQGVAQGD